MNIRAIEGKVAVVTGASRGIGEAIARRLALAGAHVVVAARTVAVRDPRLPGTVNTVADSIKVNGGDAFAVASNLQKSEEREQLIEQTMQRYGQIDILVNNAAILVPGATIGFSERYYDRMFEILVKAPFHLCQLALPNMIERGSGSILNVSSKAAVHPKPGRKHSDGAVYGMTKAAIERFSTGLAAEMYEHGISVNALSPDSYIATPGQMFGRKYTQEMIDRAEAIEDIAEAALQLVAADPTQVTGGIRYTAEVLKQFQAEPCDIGMAAPNPN